MSILEAPSAASASSLAVEHPIEEQYLQSILAAKFGDVIVKGWDADNVDIGYFDQPDRVMAGALEVTVQTIEPDGAHVRHIEIDEHHRPFPEEIITMLGKPAVAKDEERKHHSRPNTPIVVDRPYVAARKVRLLRPAAERAHIY